MAVDPKQLSEKTDRLSPLPELWEPLVELSLFGTWHPEKLVGLIERDLALSARVLAVANSEQYGKPGQVLTIPAHAVSGTGHGSELDSVYPLQ